VSETADDSRRYFNVERVPATNLDALLAATEAEGHRLIHLRVERRAGTVAYVYTAFFKRGAVVTKASKSAAAARTQKKREQKARRR
jgi:hypothetical protein